MIRGKLLFTPALYILGVFLLGASITAGVFMLHVIVVPLVFKYSKTFRRCLIFANFVQWPLYIDYENPSANGIDGGRNLNIQYHSKIDNCNIKIGIWHILPKSSYERLKGSFNSDDKEKLNKLMDEELTNSKTPVVLYCHGNSNSRGAQHRIKLYKFFQGMDYHTIAFDYRGYGDSTNVHPSELGVVEDALVVYDWLHSALRHARAPVVVWGHSLGTGIASHMVGRLPSLSVTLLGRPSPLPPPHALVLEAPFNNMADEVACHPLAVHSLVNKLPYFDVSFVAPFRVASEYTFRSDAYLARAPLLPLLILHAEDDVIVPFCVGEKLYKHVLRSRSEGGAIVKMHSYAAQENLGHKYICDAKDLSHVVGDFVKNLQ